MTQRPAVRYRLAIHEAGHAVVGHFLDLSPRRIVIGDGKTPITKNALGYVEGMFEFPHEFIMRLETGSPAPEDIDLVRRLVASLAAGVAAEKIVRGRGRVWTSGGRQDLDAAFDLCMRIHASNQGLAKLFLRYCQAFAEAEVRTHWTWIEGITAELLRTGEISGEEFVDLIASITNHVQA